MTWHYSIVCDLFYSVSIFHHFRHKLVPKIITPKYLKALDGH